MSTVPGAAPARISGVTCRSGRRLTSFSSAWACLKSATLPSVSDGMAASISDSEWYFEPTTRSRPTGASTTCSLTTPSATVWRGTSTTTDW